MTGEREKGISRRAARLLGAAGVLVCLALPGTASAATITVTALTDDVTTNGTCTLREAISEANANMQASSADCVFDETQPFGNDTINLGAGIFELTIAPVGGGDDNLDCDLGIDTAQTDQLTVDTVSGCEAVDALAPPVIPPVASPPAATPTTPAKKKCKKGRRLKKGKCVKKKRKKK